MGFLFESFLYDFLFVISTLFGLVSWYMNSNYNYWKKRGVHYLKPEPYFGNFRHAVTFRKNLGEALQGMYVQLEGHKFAGIYRLRSPVVMFRDPELIKHVMVKDFQHFQGRGFKIDPKLDPLSQHLFLLTGPVWRILRTNLTPTFTSGKMRMMFQLMKDSSEQLTEYLSEYAEKGENVEMKEVVAKFTTDIIGTCAFGLQFNSMADPDSEFRKMGRRIFETKTLLQLKRIVVVLIPKLASVLKLSLTDEDVTKFFLKVVKETVDYRVKNNIKRNDFLQLLIQLRNHGKVEDDHHDSEHKTKEINNQSPEEKLDLTDELLAAQVFVFFLAGFETSSTTMSFALYELALNPDIQAHLRKEIDAALEECDGAITYDVLIKMEYLDKVVAETLRKYPPVPNLLRECSIPYKIPDTDVVIEKGILTVIPAFAIQRDPKYYPNPDKFDPERFSEENKVKRHPFTYLPFGEGPRNCIGMRFGLLQTKLGLLTLLASYEFSVCDGTEIPLKLNPRTPVTSSTTGTILCVTKRLKN